MSAEMRGKPVFLFCCHRGNGGYPLSQARLARVKQPVDAEMARHHLISSRFDADAWGW
ncbi:hypothetical protein BN1012_Phect1667 [Candidatus Phaeomarinobacter ectocarpi]|uniref:Uncharacterized protein n=1 Tax=Candidatus Phaeomarinibacter ectocarpi TaxID=1458461 RepID=X5MN86_9HYPH|nr:hypothetical protein BN1012_Phect1667 [Candidatus Phaeomarinobacter ectocarpi]